MLKRVAITLLCVVLTIIVSHAQIPKQQKNKAVTLFSVNRKPVTADEFIYLYKKNHLDPQNDFTKQKIEEYLELFINFKVKVEEAKTRGLDNTEVFLKEYNGYKDELRKPYLPEAKMVDSLVLLTYNRMQEEVNAAHMLVAVKSDATPADTLKAYNRIIELRRRVKNGEDFGRLAQELSDDPSARSNNGNLGYFTAMQMVYPFETAAYTTPIGGISEPVRTRFGYHILKVLDRRPARGEVEVAHIMLRTGNGKENAKVKDTIFDLYDQLRGGVNWEELCRQYSEDASTKEDGGKLKPFGTGAMAAIPEFEKAAFSLQKPGDISDPFQTQYGWHIVRLERKIPVPPFEELAPSLKLRVARDERTELSKRDLQFRLRSDYRLSENEAVKTRVMYMADSSIQKGQWKPSKSAKEDKTTLFTINGGGVLVKEFVEYAERHQRTSTLAPQKYMDQLYNQFVDARIIQLLEAKIMEEHPDYRFLLQEYYEGILLFDIMEKEVWSKASQDTVGQRSFYSSHKNNYATGERARVTFYSSANRQFVEPVQKLIADSAFSQLDEYASAHKLKSEVGYFKKGERSLLEKVPWTAGLYPVENNGIYYLAWLKEILPPGFMSFEEARPAIISDYQTFLEKEWIKRLKRKYSVKVNEKGKQYILQQLQKG